MSSILTTGSLLREEQAAYRLPVDRQGNPSGARQGAALTVVMSDDPQRRNSRRRFAMCIVSACLGLTLLAALPSTGISQDKSGWQSLSHVEVTSPGQNAALEATWKDVIDAQTSYLRDVAKRPISPGGMARFEAIDRSIQIGSASYLVSIASVRGCDNGANDKNAGIEPSVCQVRISNPATGKVIATGTACYVEPSDPDVPSKNKNDRTQISVDAATRTIRFRTYVGERLWSRCQTTITLK